MKQDLRSYCLPQKVLVHSGLEGFICMLKILFVSLKSLCYPLIKGPVQPPSWFVQETVKLSRSKSTDNWKHVFSCIQTPWRSLKSFLPMRTSFPWSSIAETIWRTNSLWLPGFIDSVLSPDSIIKHLLLLGLLIKCRKRRANSKTHFYFIRNKDTEAKVRSNLAFRKVGWACFCSGHSCWTFAFRSRNRLNNQGVLKSHHSHKDLWSAQCLAYGYSELKDFARSFEIRDSQLILTAWINKDCFPLKQSTYKVI